MRVSEGTKEQYDHDMWVFSAWRKERADDGGNITLWHILPILRNPVGKSFAGWDPRQVIQQNNAYFHPDKANYNGNAEVAYSEVGFCRLGKI